MKPNNRTDRILALDVRAYQIGYVELEKPKRLLAFGVTRFKSVPVGVMRLTHLVHRLKPTTLVIRQLQASSSRNTEGTRKFLHLARQTARQSPIALSTFSDTQIREHFSAQGATTKYKIAVLLTNRFPELEWKLPPLRKPWKREHPNMSIFDAAALAVTCLDSADHL